jgi:signal transduction histidine kinase
MDARTRRWTADAALAALATGADLAVILGSRGHHGGHPSRVDPFGIILVVTGGLALLARRPYPATTLAVVLGATLGAGALGAPGGWFALIIAFFSAVLRGRRWAAVGSLVIGYAVSVWGTSLAFALGLLTGLVTLLSVAELSRARNARVAADRRQRAEAAARLASEERLAIARDLHDVVAHSISVINVQASTALHLMDRQPERARTALTAIREVSGEALGELRTVLEALRDGRAPLAPTPGVPTPGVPTPGVARLEELAARARAAGLSVSVSSEGTVRPLPAGVDAAAYRITQEALTNAVRHSGGSMARILIRYEPDSVEISVVDDGTGDGQGAGGSGNGLAGMSERITALGGSFQAGPRPDGGFGVTARLPA